MQHEYPSVTLDDLPRVARAILAERQHPVLCFQGPMGAGKTTLIRALCQELGVKEAVASPTYALVHEYRDSQERPVYHFDWYRLEEPEEALDLGLDYYLEEGALCLMEWPEKIRNFLPPASEVIYIRPAASGLRRIDHQIPDHE